MVYSFILCDHKLLYGFFPQQAAVMLRAWEIAMEKEKEERHSTLKEKVNLQHHLMDRNEEYFQQRKIAKFKLRNQV